MKQILIILGLFASVSTFAQSPRIKLNQITKDTVKGSVLISSPTDSGMVYSRDFYVAYGLTDTVLILYGDTLASTSAIISSVLSDGVTITGDGTIGSELTVDTANVIATKQDLDLYYLDSNPDGYTSNTGTVTSVGGTGTVNGISLSGTVTSSGNLTLGGTLSGVDLASQITGTLPVANGGTGSDTLNYVDLSSAQTVGGAKTFTSALNQSGGDVNFDSGTLFVDVSENRVGIGTTTPVRQIEISATNPSFSIRSTSASGFSELYFGDNTADNGWVGYAHNGDYMYLGTNSSSRMRITSDGEVWIANSSDQGAYNLQVGGTGVWGAGAYVNGSDRLLKENIQSLNKGLDYIKKLNPVQYNYKSTFSLDQSKQLGFIAQDVMVALKDISDAIVKDNGNYLSMAYQNLIPITVKAIQEQQAIIDQQKNEIEQLKSHIQLILSEIEQIKNN